MTDADLHAARQTDLNIAFAKSDWKEREMTMPIEPKRWHWTGFIIRFVNGSLVESLEHSVVRSDPSPALVLWSDYDALRAHAEAETRRAEQAEAALAEAKRDAERWKDYAKHQETCGWCANSIDDCDEGQKLRDAAIDAEKERK